MARKRGKKRKKAPREFRGASTLWHMQCLRWPLADGLDDSDEYHGTNEGDEETPDIEPTDVTSDTEEAKYPAPQSGADDTDDDIEEDALLAIGTHDHGCDPTDETSEDDIDEKTHNGDVTNKLLIRDLTRLFVDIDLNLIGDIYCWTRGTSFGVGVLITSHSRQPIDVEEESDNRHDHDTDEDTRQPTASVTLDGCRSRGRVDDGCHKNMCYRLLILAIKLGGRFRCGDRFSHHKQFDETPGHDIVDEHREDGGPLKDAALGSRGTEDGYERRSERRREQIDEAGESGFGVGTKQFQYETEREENLDQSQKVPNNLCATVERLRATG